MKRFKFFILLLVVISLNLTTFGQQKKTARLVVSAYYGVPVVTPIRPGLISDFESQYNSGTTHVMTHSPGIQLEYFVSDGFSLLLEGQKMMYHVDTKDRVLFMNTSKAFIFQTMMNLGLSGRWYISGQNSGFFLNAGIGGATTTIDWNLDDANAAGLSVQAGLGYRLPILNWLGLNAEVKSYNYFNLLDAQFENVTEPANKMHMSMVHASVGIFVKLF
ncbi:MAG: porin family protein [Prolixibacteraceae bacterium]|nr:porin family protein [Prolixibacteraceae bacterium]